MDSVPDRMLHLKIRWNWEQDIAEIIDQKKRPLREKNHYHETPEEKAVEIV